MTELYGEFGANERRRAPTDGRRAARRGAWPEAARRFSPHPRTESRQGFGARPNAARRLCPRPARRCRTGTRCRAKWRWVAARIDVGPGGHRIRGPNLDECRHPFQGQFEPDEHVGRRSYKLPFKLDFDEFEDTYPEIDDQRFYGFKQLSFSSNCSDPSCCARRSPLTFSVRRRACGPNRVLRCLCRLW